jgi:hypothetical protein
MPASLDPRDPLDPRDARAMAARSIREPGASPRDQRGARDAREPRLVPPSGRPGRHAPASASPARTPRARPDANPARLMIGLAGLASAAAFTTAMLPSVTPTVAADEALAPVVVAAADPTAAPSVRHVTQYVQLKAGQTAPPKSTVVVKPTPTPRVKVKVVVKTRQSGKP